MPIRRRPKANIQPADTEKEAWEPLYTCADIMSLIQTVRDIDVPYLGHYIIGYKGALDEMEQQLRAETERLTTVQYVPIDIDLPIVNDSADW